ncbi:MAG: phosphate transport system regulatory protein PhoU [Candidatus Tectimicrobiota bacterium]|nr:MAG: phosphate transport system regulatory protein PhoU [Candidatus Tectomicrobia bacterium]
MSKHFQREIDNLKKKILTVGATVEERIAQAIAAVIQHDAKLAEQVAEGDEEIDMMEVEVEEECLKILALYQPVAIDLRFVVAVLKINNDLERMADLAVNIARRASYLARYPNLEVPPHLAAMAQKTQAMVKQSLDALVRQDPELARRVCAADYEVDQLNRQMHVLIQAQIRATPERVEQLIHMLSVSRHLERIADLATNVAEDVIYTVTGEIVRHRTAAYS